MTTTLNLIIDTNSKNTPVEKFKNLDNILSTIKINIINFSNNFQDITDFINDTSKNDTKFVLLGEQESLYLFADVFNSNKLPFAFLNSGNDLTTIKAKLIKIANTTITTTQNYIKYQENTTETIGVCQKILIGTKVYKNILKNTYQNNNKLSRLPKEITQNIPKFYQVFPLEFYQKGKFLNFNKISNLTIKSTNQQLEAKLNYFLFNKTRKHPLQDNSFRIITTYPIPIIYDELLPTPHPLDLTLNLITLTLWKF